MQKYKCTHCDNILSETSYCSVCGQKTLLDKSEIYYCKECNSPVFDNHCYVCNSKCERIGTDLRPVFAEERLLLEVLLDEPFKFAGKSVWNLGSNYFLVDGVKIKIPFFELKKKDTNQVIQKLKSLESENKKYIETDFSNENIQTFIKCNYLRLNVITDEAIDYIKKVASNFDLDSMFVSFSGGKDSTVTSNLVMRALNTESIIHIYGDTTLEYPTTQEYVEEFRKAYPKTPVLIAKNHDQTFDDLCNVVGPPSRVMRWCCTVFKTGTISRKIEQTFSGKTRLLSFQGIRRLESLSRSKYDRDTDSPKISKQQVSSPIIDWTEFDVWLYILSNNIPFNYAYRQGFSRVGCWCCPNNSGWSEFLSSIYMNEKFNNFRSLLYSFAKKVGKPDWKEYIDEGNWKARQGGNGLEHSKNAVVSFKPCAFDETSFNYSLSRPISETLYTLFIPFGTLNFEFGNQRLGEVYIFAKNTQTPFLKISGKIGSTELKVTVLNIIHPYKNIGEISKLIRYQITKFQTCIGCSYCQSVCKYNALKVLNLEKGNVSNDSISYIINSSKCVGCLECVKHFDGGCYMKKVLKIKKDVSYGQTDIKI